MSSSPAPESRRGVLLAALLLLPGLLPGSALAQQAEPEDSVSEPPAAEEPAPAAPAAGEPAPADDAMPAEEAGETVIIYDQAEVARRRKALEADIRALDYRTGKDKGDRTIFRPEAPWKPSVIVHDDGRVETKRSPVRWQAPGRQDNPLNQLWCLPPFTPMCVRIGGQVVSKRKLQPRKQDVLDEIDAERDAWVEALVGQASWARINEEIPARLEATWSDGAPLEPGGPALPDPTARRGAMLDFWASRSDTTEGDMAARVVADFLSEVVQGSEHPVTWGEQAAANGAAGGQRVLDLPGISRPTPPPAPDVVPDGPPGGIPVPDAPAQDGP